MIAGLLLNGASPRRERPKSQSRTFRWYYGHALGSMLLRHYAASLRLTPPSTLHNLDYAKAACEHVLSMPKPGLATKTFQLGQQMQFCARYTRIWTPTENEVIDALAVEPLCRYHNDTRPASRVRPRGLSENLSQDNHVLKRAYPHWELHLDYQPGSRSLAGLGSRIKWV